VNGSDRLPPDFLPLTPSRRLTVTSADGARLAVQIHEGDGGGIPPTVVLVHGWTLSATFWVRVVRRLVPDLRVVVYDQRGHGRSGPVPDGGFTPAGIADDLAAVLRAAVPDGERAVVAGHSMGAMALVAFGARHRHLLHDRVGAALLASTGVEQLLGRTAVLPGLRGRSGAREALDGSAPARLGPLRTTITRRALGDARSLHRMPLRLARATLVRTTMSPTATPQERAFCTDLVLACPERSYQGFGEMLASLDLSADLPMLDVPARVLVGTADRLTPPWHARRMATALPRSRGLIEVAGAGHMTPLTAPGAVAGAIRELADGWRGASVRAAG
jgi:pimeloyl-ACP methyl ester carboxylesterase